jgi:hypothetical protein
LVDLHGRVHEFRPDDPRRMIQTEFGLYLFTSTAAQTTRDVSITAICVAEFVQRAPLSPIGKYHFDLF